MDDADGGLLEGLAVACFALLELLLGALALADVSNDAVHFEGIAQDIETELSGAMDPAHLLVHLPDDAVFLVEWLALSDNLISKIGRHHCPIIGMNKRLPSSQGAAVLLTDAEDLIEDIGTGPAARGNIQGVAAESAYSLRFRQGLRTFVERRFCPLPLGDVALDGDEACDFAKRIANRCDAHLLVIECSILTPVDQYTLPDLA